MTFLITGATGLLGGWLVAELERAGLPFLACGGPSRAGGVDLCDRDAVTALVERVRPTHVIHAAALSAIADCAREPERARALNVGATANVARAARSVSAHLVHVSTDMVFEGEDAPYDERAVPAPMSIYGKTKLDAEREALASPGGLVVRVSLLFGPTRTERRGFFDNQVADLRAGKPCPCFEDEWRTPLSLRAAAEALVAVARSEASGLLHIGGPERMSRLEMGIRLARSLGVSEEAIGRASRTLAPGEPRPRDVSLDSGGFRARFPGLATASFEDECARMLEHGRRLADVLFRMVYF